MAERRPAVHLRSVNLNLLPILEALLSHRSVSVAATKLHMSQSAVSDALARLRVQFRDELLVRKRREMVLTPLAQELAAPLREVLGGVSTLVDRQPLDPKALTREFVVATADPVMMTIGPPMLRALNTRAPNVSVQFVDLHHSDYERLRALELDAVIVPRGYLRRTGLVEAPLFDEPFVCIARRDHPDIRRKLDRAVYSRLPHVSYRAERDSRVSMDARMLGLPQQDVLKVPSFALLPFLVERSNAIALVQRRVAERFVGVVNIAVHAPPLPIEPLHVCAYWSAGHERDAAHGWFRALLREVAEGV